MSIPVLKSVFEEPKPVKEKTLLEYYLAKAKYHADQGKDYWLVDGLTGEKRFFRNFSEETCKIASAFYKLGLRKENVVMYMVRDLCKLHILFNGVWRGNGMLRAVYPDDDLSTVLSRVIESHSKIIVCEEELIELCKSVGQKLDWEFHVVTMNRTDSGLLSIQEILNTEDGSSCPEFSLSEDDPCVIFCTSGTTGLPKGAVHTHGSLLYMIRGMERLPFTYPKPNLIATRATHISGCILPLAVFGQGKTVVALSNITQENVFKVASQHKVGLTFAFPTFLVAMAGPQAEGYDFSSLDVILTGGVPITPAISQALMRLPNVKDIVATYGLTETVLCTTNAILKYDSEREVPTMRDTPDFSVGKPYPGTDLQIRDPETLEILGPGQRGEICVKTRSLFHSYLNSPEATKSAFVDGFLRSGDLGYFDGVTGFVFVVDRLKEIFKYYNNHISPTELENVVGQHPRVHEVCVYGVADEGGHVPRAVVTILPGSDSEDRQALAEEIKEFADARLASYKKLRGGLYILDEMPKGKSGKITRQLVEKIFKT